MPLMQIGEAIVAVNSKVQNDFQIRCYRNDFVEQQVGETCCLHTAFVEQSYARVRLTNYMQLDLFFSDYKP